MTTLMVGCPVLRREWIIDRWIKHVLAAVPMNFDLSFAFVGASNDPTFDVISQAVPSFIPVYHQGVIENRDADRRQWNMKRYERMAELRNTLLCIPRFHSPDYFLSLDSDILLHPEAIKVMLEDFGGFDVIGGKTYLSERGRNVPTYAYLTGYGLRRKESVNVLSPDVLMAIKLMKPQAYNVDYAPHRQGEDIGYSLNCKKAGLSLGWTGRVASKHVMRPELLEVTDDRVGY